MYRFFLSIIISVMFGLSGTTHLDTPNVESRSIQSPSLPVSTPSLRRYHLQDHQRVKGSDLSISAHVCDLAIEIVSGQAANVDRDGGSAVTKIRGCVVCSFRDISCNVHIDLDSLRLVGGMVMG